MGPGAVVKKDWWPDWTGKTVVIAASGPSQSKAQLDLAKGLVPVIAVNSTWTLCPWADVLYSNDARWWRHAKPEFDGLRISGQPMDGCKQFATEVRSTLRLDGYRIASGGNSGFMALNLALVFGSRRVILTGIDLEGGHWHGDHPRPLANPHEIGFQKWQKAFDTVAETAAEIGAEIINASPISEIKGLPKMTVREALG